MSMLKPYSAVLIHLWKNVLYQEKQPDLWNSLINYQAALQEYVGVVGLQVVIDESEGYAFLHQHPDFISGEETLPRLIQRRPLSYTVSLLCVMLRKKLLEHDATSGDIRLIITHKQIIDMLHVYLPERANEAKTVEQIDTCINKTIEMGFLRRLDSGGEKQYEIRRIIKAFVDAEFLSDIEKTLSEYQVYADELN